MPTAFCPGHLTCFFQPAGPTDGNYAARGSRGAGIRISLGATVTVSERSDRTVKVVIDGTESSAPVTKEVLRLLLPERGLDVDVTDQIPCGQGFGLSAAGAVAAAFCASEMADLNEDDAFRAAHRADIVGGGGLGDVAALQCLADQPVRETPGLPPLGKVTGTGLIFRRLTLAVLGPKMNTGTVLGDSDRRSLIERVGKETVNAFLAAPTHEALFRLANQFSVLTMVESPAVADAVRRLRGQGIRAGMCMLGNSIFADAGLDEVREVLAADVPMWECRSTASPAKLIRTE
ncbi:MAG: pantothenate kinase [Methanomethylophilus sp.]|nr:pantothenate kinase [Methanomethylophilus sp.]